ncbi:MAG: hypothetical protein ACREU4_13795, partial [Burkholderiales bacterium]
EKETDMLNKTFALAALAGAALLAAAPAFADGYRHSHNQRVVLVQQHAPYYAQRRWGGYRAYAHRPVVVHRPVLVRPAPVVVYRQYPSHDVLGGLIVGAMIGAVIASHAGY